MSREFSGFSPVLHGKHSFPSCSGTPLRQDFRGDPVFCARPVAGFISLWHFAPICAMIQPKCLGMGRIRGKNVGTKGIAKAVFRPQYLPARPADADRRAARRPGCAGRHAHRGRKVHVLSDSGPGHGGDDPGDFSPHFPDGRSGGGPQSGGGSGGVLKLGAGPGGVSRGTPWNPAGDVPAFIRGAGAADGAGVPGRPWQGVGVSGGSG